MSGAFATAFGAAGFLSNLFGGSRNTRFILTPTVDPTTGNQVVDSNGDPIYQGINPYIALSEDHYDDTEITEHPVEQGAVITDHAYLLPRRLTMRIGWSPSSPTNSGNLSVLDITLPTFSGFFGQNSGQGAAFIKSVYAQLLALRQARSLCVIYTGKCIYQNMMLKTVQETTTDETENVLEVTAIFHEIILVNTSTVTVPINTAAGAQGNPQSTTPPSNRGNIQGENLPPANGAIPGSLDGYNMIPPFGTERPGSSIGGG